eukprot:8202351-Alexandrium_andersonii.AAC.1
MGCLRARSAHSAHLRGRRGCFSTCGLTAQRGNSSLRVAPSSWRRSLPSSTTTVSRTTRQRGT